MFRNSAVSGQHLTDSQQVDQLIKEPKNYEY